MGDKREKTGGRKAGTPNKSTASAKAAMIEAFDELGGADSLVEWGKENQTDFYKLWSKLIPADIKADVNSTGEITINVVSYTSE